MGKAYSEDLAWRVVFRVLFCGQSYGEVCDKQHGLAVSREYIDAVLSRYDETGDVATHQGHAEIARLLEAHGRA